MKPPTTQTFQLGTLTIAVSDPNFQAGYEIGYREYIHIYQGKTLTDFDLLTIQLGKFTGVAVSATHKIGVITGWYAAMFGYEQHATGEQP